MTQNELNWGQFRDSELGTGHETAIKFARSTYDVGFEPLLADPLQGFSRIVRKGQVLLVAKPFGIVVPIKGVELTVSLQSHDFVCG